VRSQPERALHREREAAVRSQPEPALPREPEPGAPPAEPAGAVVPAGEPAGAVVPAGEPAGAVVQAGAVEPEDISVRGKARRAPARSPR